jgi:hypothetical protein
VDKNGEGIKNTAGHLMCYAARAVKEAPQARHTRVLGIFLNNQVAAERVDTVKEGEFCVPSVKILP